MDVKQALSLIREIPDYPKPGVRFQDITPLLASGEAFSAITKKFASFGAPGTLVAGIEARGFIIAAAVAHELGSGFIPIRKSGKLPHTVISESYNLEYGNDTLEVHVDAITAGTAVMLIDDVLATGGTFSAGIELINRSGGHVMHLLTILEIASLGGRARLHVKYPHINISSLVTA